MVPTFIANGICSVANPHLIKRALCLSRSFELNVKLLDKEKVL